MADEAKKPEDNKEVKVPKPIVLTITIDPEKGLMVQAPGNGTLYDEPMCLYMLEKAKDRIKLNNAKELAPRLYQPNQPSQGAFGGQKPFGRRR